MVAERTGSLDLLQTQTSKHVPTHSHHCGSNLDTLIISISKFLISAGNAEFFDGNATVDKALEKLGLNGQYKLLPGMTVSLMPHQTIGVAWALDREKSSDKGGLLGDEMGLGKTVQIIALMVANASDDPLCKTNLIIAPVALLGQWELEIEMKTANGMKCLIYHGG
jgi:SNF2 family DNA or RNA helicase